MSGNSCSISKSIQCNTRLPPKTPDNKPKGFYYFPCFEIDDTYNLNLKLKVKYCSNDLFYHIKIHFINVPLHYSVVFGSYISVDKGK